MGGMRLFGMSADRANVRFDRRELDLHDASFHMNCRPVLTAPNLTRDQLPIAINLI
jgi:hypothetical protein